MESVKSVSSWSVSSGNKNFTAKDKINVMLLSNNILSENDSAKQEYDDEENPSQVLSSFSVPDVHSSQKESENGSEEKSDEQS